MGIGTSLGTYYEDEFSHQAGIVQEEPKDSIFNEKPKLQEDDSENSGMYVNIAANLTNTPGEIMEGVEGARVVPGRGGSFPPGYMDKVPQERRLSRTGVSHPGYRWEVFDPVTGKVVAKDLTTKVGANRSVDRWDNKYGAYRYRSRPVQATDMTKEEIQFLKDAGITFD